MSQNDSQKPDHEAGGEDSHEELESYGGGHIKARHGKVNAWLLAVYLVLTVWALYYGYRYWGGLGPGLDY